MADPLVTLNDRSVTTGFLQRPLQVDFQPIMNPPEGKPSNVCVGIPPADDPRIYSYPHYIREACLRAIFLIALFVCIAQELYVFFCKPKVQRVFMESWHSAGVAGFFVLGRGVMPCPFLEPLLIRIHQCHEPRNRAIHQINDNRMEHRDAFSQPDYRST
jgi:hypothetical protein